MLEQEVYKVITVIQRFNTSNVREVTPFGTGFSNKF